MSQVTLIKGKGPRPGKGLAGRIRDAFPRNVGDSERAASAIAGGALIAAAALSKRPYLGALTAAAGAALAFRGLSGRCGVYGMLGINSCPADECLDDGRQDDIVQEASEESFPASDAPSFTPSSRVGDPQIQ